MLATFFFSFGRFLSERERVDSVFAGLSKNIKLSVEEEQKKIKKYDKMFQDGRDVEAELIG